MATTSSLASSNAGTLDVPSLVAQLMANERTPINQLNSKISGYQTKLSTLGTLKSLTSTVYSSANALSSSLTSLTASTSDSTVVSAYATSSALSGTYAVSITEIAQAQRLVATGQTSSTAALTSSASTVGVTIGGTTKTVAIGANASLQNIADAINAADLGVTATIVNDGSGSPYRLAISANETGTANAVSSITVQTGGDAALNDLLAYNPTENVPTPVNPLLQKVAATDADFEVNGIRIQRATNTISDAIPGVTFSLIKKSASATVTVARDTTGAQQAVSDFVDAYNALATQLKSKTSYKTSTTDGGLFAGDGTIIQMLQNMRSVILTPATGGTLSTLSEVGITFQSDGSLKFDSSKLNTALKTGYSDVVNLFTSTSGFATRMASWANTVVQTGGTLDGKVSTYNTTIANLNTQISHLEVKMTALEKKYTLTYATLNQLLDSMNKTGQYLTQQFSSKSS